ARHQPAERAAQQRRALQPGRPRDERAQDRSKQLLRRQRRRPAGRQPRHGAQEEAPADRLPRTALDGRRARGAGARRAAVQPQAHAAEAVPAEHRPAHDLERRQGQRPGAGDEPDGRRLEVHRQTVRAAAQARRVRDPVRHAGPPDHQPRAVDQARGARAARRRAGAWRARLGQHRQGAGHAAHGGAVLPGVPAQAQPRHVAVQVDARGGPAVARGGDDVRRGRLAGGGVVPGQPHGPAGAAPLVQVDQPGHPLGPLGQGRGRGAAGGGAAVRRRPVDQDRQARAGPHRRQVPRALHERADARRQQRAVDRRGGRAPGGHRQPRGHRQVVVRRRSAGQPHRQPVLAPLAQPAQEGQGARAARRPRGRARRGGHRAQLPG
ncbi:hypothetical protein GGI00_006181, partial [Coemansia sp. RSA 2681]